MEVKKSTAHNSRYTQLPGRGVANAVHLATFRITQQVITKKRQPRIPAEVSCHVQQPGLLT